MHIVPHRWLVGAGMCPARWLMAADLDQVPMGWQAKYLDLSGDNESTADVDRQADLKETSA
jgi:hypothetical protein